MDRSKSVEDNITNSSIKESPFVACRGNGGNNHNKQEGSTSNNHGNGVALRHNPGLSLNWTSQELSVLEDLLPKYASDRGYLRYAKIAVELKEKNIRDVALFCRWMTKKENGKRRKEDVSSSRKKKNKKEEGVNPSGRTSMHVRDRAYAPPYAQTANQMDSNDGISYKDIGGRSVDLLERNDEVLNQVSNNFLGFRIHDNLDLFRQARKNFAAILADLYEMPELMNGMPPLFEKLDEELINSVIPPTP